jgi:hypothetical protein
MSAAFQLRHIPALFAASTQTFGGLWPLWNAPAAMVEFGFPARIAESPTAAPVMTVGTARTTAIGLIMFVFYAQGNYQAVDTVLAITGGWAALVDTWVVWREGNQGHALFRLVGAGVLSAWAFAGMTSGGI